VRDYIVESVGGVLDSANITYVKWDMNRHSTALGNKAYDYILGLYEVLDRIFTPRPQILLESCASGGNRFDLGMMCYSPQVWCSDDTDPIERLDIQDGLSYLYPQSVMGAHVSAAPHAQTLRSTPLTTRGNVSFFGLLGYELDLGHLVAVEEKEIRAQIEFYKKHRATFQFGRFSRLRVEDAVGWQVSDDTHHLAGVFHRLVHAAPGYQYLAVKGLNTDSRYRVSSRPQGVRVGQFGALLKHVAPVTINPNGAILRTADRHYTMDEGGQQFTATGAALMSGWPMPPRFMGTGYDKALRVQGDFGSILYEIEEETSK
jgi:alpha-galactosidase